MKIYIPGHCEIYFEDGSHHERCLLSLQEALEIMTDEWISEQNYCDQTIIDMRDALIALTSQEDELQKSLLKQVGKGIDLDEIINNAGALE